MTSVWNLHQLRMGNLLAEDVGVERRNEPIILAPHHERRSLDPPQPSFQSVFRNRKEKLGRRPKAARDGEQNLNLLWRAVVTIIEKHRQQPHSQRRRARLVVKERGDQLDYRLAE